MPLIFDLARRMIRLVGLKPAVAIPVVSTGLCPGEPLRAEIPSAAESPPRLKADGVFIASPRLVGPWEITGIMDKAIRAARAGEAEAVIALLTTEVRSSREERPNPFAAGPEDAIATPASVEADAQSILR